LRDEVEVLKDLNEQKAVFMLCGSMQMGKAVEDLLKETFDQNILQVWSDEGRWCKEVWSE